jgi:hypothetical protein
MFFAPNHRGNHIKDPDGEDFPSVQAAETEAIAAARELAGNALRSGKGLVVVTFDIMDEAGKTVAIIPFEKAMTPD